MPPVARPLPERLTELPAGISLVSFFTPASAGHVAGSATAPPDGGPPYAGAMGVECVRGAAGELIEIIHCP